MITWYPVLLVCGCMAYEIQFLHTIVVNAGVTIIN